MPDNLKINSERLWTSLMEMAQIGATLNGGVCRLAASADDKVARDLFITWCRAEGCEILTDQIGNLFARRAGQNNNALPVVMGSHLDSQPTGGKFDGVYGVLAGLEVIRTLNAGGVQTDAPVEIAVWMNEEGARFSPAMLGSGVHAGAFSLEYGLDRKDTNGVSLRDALAMNSLSGDAPLGRKIGAHFEAHIEQGPILEAEQKTLGIVMGVQGIKWFDITVVGAESHAGPTPMRMRRDPLQKAVILLQKFFALIEDHGEDARITVGEIHSYPSSRNTVPGSVKFSLDLRHPDPKDLQKMQEKVESIVRQENEPGIPIKLEEIWYSPPISFDASCIAAIRDATIKTGHAAMDMISGAGHDSVYISRVAPTGMIFVPCKGGVSHNEAESAKQEDLAAGCDVLLHAVLNKAGVVV